MLSMGRSIISCCFWAYLYLYIWQKHAPLVLLACAERHSVKVLGLGKIVRSYTRSCSWTSMMQKNSTQ